MHEQMTDEVISTRSVKQTHEIRLFNTIKYTHCTVRVNRNTTQYALSY